MFGELAPWVSMADALGWCETWQARKVMGAGMVERHGNRPARPATEPAFTIRSDAGGAAPGGFVLDRRQQHDGLPVVDCDTEPAPTLTGIAGSRSQWVFREIQGHGAVRTLDQPAMTIPASADNGNYRFELWPHRRPATTVAGDPRI